MRRVREKGKEEKNSAGCRIFLRLKPYQNKPFTFYDARLRASSNLYSAPIRVRVNLRPIQKTPMNPSRNSLAVQASPQTTSDTHESSQFGLL